MNNLVGGIFGLGDHLKMEALSQRLTRTEVITANIANAETPGFRAIGYNFEEQLQAIGGADTPFALKANHPKHFRNNHTEADGTIRPDVFLRPSESVGQDGNTVDVDSEMAKMAENQILYRATVDLINRKVAKLRYAISGGA